MRGDRRVNSSMYAVLGILALGPQTGYDIKKMMERSTSYFWNENYGQIYPYLGKLLEQGNVTVHIEKQDGKPDRKVYTITEQGRDCIAEWLRLPIDYSFMDRKNELLLRLFFGHHAPAEVNIRHLLEFKGKLQEMAAVLDTIEHSIKACHPEDKNLSFWLLTTSYGKTQARALIQWAEESMDRLESANEGSLR